MKSLIFLSFSLISVNTNAQIQFWNNNDVENAQWEQYYASQKIRKIRIYKIDENNKRLFPDMPQTIKDYDASSRLIADRYNKYNWSKKGPELLAADSFFYNDKGQLSRYSVYDGPQMKYITGMEFLYNPKGQQIRQDTYGMENYQRVKTGSDVIIYSPAGKAVKLVSKNTASAMDHTRLFIYDSHGRLTRADFITDGNTITTAFTWNDKGLLMGYKESEGTKTTKEVSFIYDDKGRRISRHIESEGGYRDNTTYIYYADKMLPYVVHTTYPGDKNADLRFENQEYEYEFY